MEGRKSVNRLALAFPLEATMNGVWLKQPKKRHRRLIPAPLFISFGSVVLMTNDLMIQRGLGK